MDVMEKLVLAAQAMDLEPGEEAGQPAARGCGYTPAELRRRGLPKSAEAKGHSIPVYAAALPGGRRIPLLKAMLTTACERDCLYCGFRAGRDERRVVFKPEEMAKIYAEVHRAGVAQGLFLSTGMVAGGPNTQNLLLDVAEILRRRFGYRGYLHLKIMPGAERGQVLRAMQLADRVSVNLECPSPERLVRIAPTKRFVEELLLPLRWVDEIRRTLPRQQAWGGRWPSSTTQFVVGAAGESDLEILATTAWLTREVSLARSYFSAFSPVPGTPLENQAPENPRREHRLYQASFLLRDYGFELEELSFTPDGRLPLERDPKLAYASESLAERPVDLNHAEREELLRVPGIGPKGAAALLRRRREGGVHDLGDLRKLGILAERAAPYIILDGRLPPRQLRLF
jgi:predicted DNA-binding helix-hairpin-helix protein